MDWINILNSKDFDLEEYVTTKYLAAIARQGISQKEIDDHTKCFDAYKKDVLDPRRIENSIKE